MPRKSWIFTDWDGNEFEVFSSPNHADIDGDGANDREEFIAGTDPNAIPVVRLDEARYLQVKELLTAATARMQVVHQVKLSELVLARLNYERMETLHRVGVVTTAELNQAKAQLDQAEDAAETTQDAFETATELLQEAAETNAQAIKTLGQLYETLDGAFAALGTSKPSELNEARLLLDIWTNE